MPALVKIEVNPVLYLRDPETTDLGRKIVDAAIEFIDLKGFDELTFKKLAELTQSTEASLYRYFESKLQLLQYLVAWYWMWMDYIISLRTTNLSHPQEKLSSTLRLMLMFDENYRHLTHINTEKLRRVIVAESARVYLTKQEKKINSAMLEGYRSLCDGVINTLKQINSNYPHAQALATTIVSSVHKQILFANYLSEESSAHSGPAALAHDIEAFLNQMTLATLGAE